MFTLARIIGNVSVGTFQPNTIEVVGSFVCPSGTNSGIDLYLTVTAPAGGPLMAIPAQTSTGAPGTPSLGTVTFPIPAWAAVTCGTQLEFDIQGMCAGQLTPPEHFKGQIDCFCPRIGSLQANYGACSGAPPRQIVTLTATVMLNPGTSSNFSWDFGDGGHAAGGTLTNSTGSWTATQTLTTTHDYDASGASYLACLKSSECPQVCLLIQPSCSTSTCPTVSINPPVFGTQCINGQRLVTLTAQVSAQAAAAVYWDFGGGNFGPPTNIPLGLPTPVPGTHSYLPGTYTATLKVFSPASCPDTPKTFTVPACPTTPCPDPTNPVTVTVTTPNSPTWCAPVQGLSAGFAAQVNWPNPAQPNLPPVIRYDWTVTLPDNRTATQSSSGTNVTTASGWMGSGTNGGAIDLHDAGAYDISVFAVFSTNAGFPTDSNGAITCHFGGSGGFTLGACLGVVTCPSLTQLTTTSGCVDSNTGTVANITVTAGVNDPAGIAQSFVWDFGDPGTAGNLTTTTTPNASHAYATTGSFTISCKVQSSVACVDNGPKTFTTGLTVPSCTSVIPPKTTEGFGCFLLRVIAAILFALALLCVLLGLCIPALAPTIYYVAIGIAAAAVIVLIIWAIICPKPCGWLLLLFAQTFFGVGWVAIYFSSCCALMIIAGVAALLLGIGLFIAWGFLCRPGPCQVLREVAIILSGVVLPAIGFILFVPAAAACVNNLVVGILSIAAGIILTVALACTGP